MTDKEANSGLEEFERSMRQLMQIADNTTPKKPQTREQERRYGLNEDRQLAFMPQPDAQLTERRQSIDQSSPDQSPRQISKGDLMLDSVLGGSGQVYERMKTNMQKALDKQQKKKTIQEIKMRDTEARLGQGGGGQQRRNQSQMVKAQNKSQ